MQYHRTFQQELLFLLCNVAELYQMEDVCAHLNGIKAFVSASSSGFVPREAVRQHIAGATKALGDNDKHITTMKRRIDAKTQEADVLQKQLPPRKVVIVPVGKDVSIVIYYTHASKFKIHVSSESRVHR